MKTKTTNTTPATSAKTEYTPRLFLCPSYYTTDSGDRVDTWVLMSVSNYWYINVSKSGKLYGRMRITGDWNLKQLSRAFPNVEFDGEEYVTLFFKEHDAEYLTRITQGVDKPSSNRSFVANISIQTGENGASLVAHVKGLL